MSVAFLQRQAERGAQGLLAATEENAAVNFPGAVKRGKFVVQQSRPQHETAGGQILFRSRPLGRAGFEHRLQHEASLSPARGAGNVSLKTRRQKIRLACCENCC